MSDKYVLIQGLGLNQGGVGAARYFAQKYKQVLVTDLKSEKELQPSLDALSDYSNIQFVLGQHRPKDFKNASLLVCSPAVPPDNQYVGIARQNNIPAYTPLSYFFTHYKGTIIGVTGTRGKSTTTKLIYQILKTQKDNIYLGGNIGRSVLDFLDDLDQNSISVLEISNLMLLWLKEIEKSPQVAVLTNIYPDHLNRHPSFQHYINTKTQIFKFQSAQDLLITNQDQKITQKLASQAPSQVKYFSRQEFEYHHLVNQPFHPLSGSHNQSNIAAAVKVARYLNTPSSAIKKAISNFSGLYGRQMYTGEVKGIKIVNDTCATMPQAVIVALQRFQSFPTILLFGGLDKDLSYKKLALTFKKHPPKALVALSSPASRKLLSSLDKLDLDLPVYRNLSTLKSAVDQAFQIAKPGDLLLFSPGGSSFQRFANEFDRGEKFDQLISRYSASK